MREQQENYRPSAAENQTKGSEVSPAEKVDVDKEAAEAELKEGGVAAMPSVEDLDAILRESEDVATIASMSEKEIDEMIERRQGLRDRLRDVDIIRESRLRRVENYNPLKDLEPSDYKRLVEEEILEAPYAERLQKLDSVIAKLESLDYPSADAKAELEKLSEVRGAFREKLESKIQERQQEIATRREAVKNKVLEHYAKRAEELERVIREIESNPRVIERLHIMAEEEMREIFAKREKEKQEAAAKIEQERKKLIEQDERFIQSLRDRQKNAFKRLGEILGDEGILDKLRGAFGEKDWRKQQYIFDQVRRDLINSIIDGEGEKQLKDPSEVVPWENKTTSIPYYYALNEFQNPLTTEALEAAAKDGDTRAQRLIEQRNDIITQHRILSKIFGRKWIIDRKTGEKRLSPFWAAFETRKKNDDEGITAARKKEREEAAKREAALKEAIEEIIKRGGFAVEAPIIKVVGGKKVVVGKQIGAVRLEKKKSKKGNDYWEVVEVVGVTKNGLKVGDVSPLDMRSFPQWLSKSAKPYS